MKKVQMLCLGPKKSLSSPRLKLMAQGMVQHTDDQSQVWYHSGAQHGLRIRLSKFERNIVHFKTLQLKVFLWTWVQTVVFCPVLC